MTKISWEDEGLKWHKVLVKKELISLSIAFALISLAAFPLWYFLQDSPPSQGPPFLMLLLLVLGWYGYCCMLVASQMQDVDKYEISEGILKIEGPKGIKDEIELKTSIAKSVRNFEGFNVVCLGRKRRFYDVYVKANSTEWKMLCDLVNIDGVVDSAKKE